MTRPPFRSFVEISREQLACNYRNVCAAVGPGVEVLGVVKADAYGHGLKSLVSLSVKWCSPPRVRGFCLR